MVKDSYMSWKSLIVLVLLIFLIYNNNNSFSVLGEEQAPYTHHCSTFDTNGNFIGDSGDNLVDFDLSGIIDELDQEVFNYFQGCQYDPHIQFFFDRILITKQTTFYEITKMASLDKYVYLSSPYRYFSDNHYLIHQGTGCEFVIASNINFSIGSSIQIDNCVIKMNSTTGGQYQFSVSSGSNVSITNSRITYGYYDPYSYRFNVYPDSIFNMINSTITHVGYINYPNYPYRSGMTIATNNAVLKNSFLNFTTLVIYKSQPEINNLTIYELFYALNVIDTTLDVHDIFINTYYHNNEISLKNSILNYHSGSFSDNQYVLYLLGNSAFNRWRNLTVIATSSHNISYILVRNDGVTETGNFSGYMSKQILEFTKTPTTKTSYNYTLHLKKPVSRSYTIIPNEDTTLRIFLADPISYMVD